MRKYEYLMIKAPKGPAFTDDIEYVLNQYGKDGWELCILDYGNHFIFKRDLGTTVLLKKRG